MTLSTLFLHWSPLASINEKKNWAEEYPTESRSIVSDLFKAVGMHQKIYWIRVNPMVPGPIPIP